MAFLRPAGTETRTHFPFSFDGDIFQTIGI
jgi:hypothetical protein